jgi:putative nucleotidyltransferase with HDIG domain
MNTANHSADHTMPVHIDSIFKNPVLKTVEKVSAQLSIPAYVVGGYVRDLLLKRKTKDVDVVVLGSGTDFAEQVAKTLGKGAKLSVFKNFGTANIKYGKEEVEFVGARKESYLRNSRKPIVEAGTLEDDLSRRDFTINALAVNCDPVHAGEIVDMFKGLEDLENGILRTPLDPDITFSDDPLRMLRGVRFASQLGFKLHPETYRAIAANKDRLQIISRERIADELNKIVLSPIPSVGFKLLYDLGLLQMIMPDLVKLQGVQTIDNKSHKDNFYHTLQVLDNLAQYTDDLWLRWASILHDIGKPASQRYDQEAGWTFHGHEVIGAKMVPRIFKDLKLPLNEKMKYVQKLVMLHLRPIALTQEVTDSAIRRLIVDAGDDLEDLLKLCKADVTSKNPDKVKRYLRRFDEVWEKIKEVEEKDRLRNWKPPITGEIIMDTFGLKPSREVGNIKDAVREAILNGDIPNDYDAAFAYMLDLGKNYGLTPLSNS